VRNEQAHIREALRRFDLAEAALMKEPDPYKKDKLYLWALRAEREEALHSLIQAVRKYLKPA
jgi:hypothetical protein